MLDLNAHQLHRALAEHEGQAYHAGVSKGDRLSTDGGVSAAPEVSDRRHEDDFIWLISLHGTILSLWYEGRLGCGVVRRYEGCLSAANQTVGIVTRFSQSWRCQQHVLHSHTTLI